jgi:PAS domain S-box-containing protein
MPDSNEQVMPSDSPPSRLSPVLRRILWSAAALLIVVAGTMALRALPSGGGAAWFALTMALLAIIGVMIAIVWRKVANTSVLESAVAELGDAVAQAHEAQMRAEGEALQKARLAALLDSALSNAPLGFAFFDQELRFLRVNQTFARLTGVTPTDHIGLSLADLDPAVAQFIEPRLREVQATRQPVVNVEYRVRTPGPAGEMRSVLWSCYPIATRDGDFFGIGAAVTDVTELKTLEEQLLQAQKMEAVGRLAGGVAHDFNNLLTVISSYAELILFDEAMQGREEIAEIRGATARAAKLTRQLLAFSRRQAMEPRIVNPNDVVRGVEPMVCRLFDSNITVETSLSPDTPLIRVDPGQLEQVVMNLAINAADAMPEGGRLTIDTNNVRLREDQPRPDADLPPGAYALIRVRDTGHGMDETTVAQIFEPFFTTKEPGRGTGLGLSTVYGIVKQSNGSVSVESMPGAGSVFNVYLPAVGVDSK